MECDSDTTFNFLRPKLIQHKVTDSELLAEDMKMPKVTVYTHTVLYEAQIVDFSKMSDLT